MEEAAGDGEGGRGWELGEVEEDESTDQRVPGQHDPEAVRVEEGRDGEEDAGEQKQERARGEAEGEGAAKASVGTRCRGDGFGDQGLHGWNLHSTIPLTSQIPNFPPLGYPPPPPPGGWWY